MSLALLYIHNDTIIAIIMVVIIVFIVCDSSSRLSNGETESVKTMVVHEDGDDASSTPCKDSTLVVRQVIHTCMKLEKVIWTKFGALRSAIML